MEGIKLQIIATMRGYSEGIDTMDLWQEFPEFERRFDDFFKELVELQSKKLVFNDSSIWVVTEIGNRYYDSLSNQVETEMKIAELQHSKLLYETKVAKWMSKTYWWIFGIAIAALIISIVALFFK